MTEQTAATGTEGHTPGPWVVLSCEGTSPIYRGIICTVEQSERLTAVAAGDGRTAFPDEWSANARLIAAAPDLLEALKALRLQALQSNVNSAANEWGREALEMANDAISRAEGRTEPKAGE